MRGFYRKSWDAFHFRQCFLQKSTHIDALALHILDQLLQLAFIFIICLSLRCRRRGTCLSPSPGRLPRLLRLLDLLRLLRFNLLRGRRRRFLLVQLGAQFIRIPLLGT